MDRLKRCWENMRNNKYHIKGVDDSKTMRQVLVARESNYFSPDNCYWDFVDNLPEGVYYVDQE